MEDILHANGFATMTSTAVPFTSKSDLHVHSKYSDRPSEWVLRRVGAPESFVEPRDIYARAMTAGMSFVTISDHNKIDGALEIAHLPNTFISCEVTTYFPENGAKVHVLVSGITPQQFELIQETRKNIYEFRALIVEQDIVATLAHPLFLVNDCLTLGQVEKLLVLFNRFEVINGTRDGRAGQMVEAILRGLTPEMIARLADKHGLEPVGPAPHRKFMTGGSDDHSGLYVSSAHTITPEAGDAQQFIAHLRAGRHEPAGHSGSSVQLAHCFYNIAYFYYKSRILHSSEPGVGLLVELFRRLLDPSAEPPVRKKTRIRAALESFIWRRRKRRLSLTEQMVAEHLSMLISQPGTDRSVTPVTSLSPSPSRGPSATEAFEISCRLAHNLGYAFLRQLIEKAGQGDLIKSLEAIAAMGPVVAAITPYLAAFKTQHKDSRFIEHVAGHFGIADPMSANGVRRAWATDTIEDVNGVAHTIKTLAGIAHRQGRQLTVLTCVPDLHDNREFDFKNFQPVGLHGLPEYPTQRVAFPPFLEIIEYIERQRFNELIISTPGPIGLTTLAAAKLLQLRTVGIYHTDFPNLIRSHTDDPDLEALSWRYMLWFFNQLDTILVPSEYYRRYLVEHGFSASKIGLLRRGVDTSRFSPDFRDESLWKRYGGRLAFTFLYVGRISSDKNVQMLLEAFEKLLASEPHYQLVVVGDGPDAASLRERYRRHAQINFTGYLKGRELAAAYASADVFVFPSTTDTFGNAVLEAQASGLPAIVSDRGGPQEIIAIHNAGVILDLSDPSAGPSILAEAMRALAANQQLRSELRELALRTAADMTWSVVLDHLWSTCQTKQPNGSPACLFDPVLSINSADP